ncbi:hypothetical protein FH972_023716 [Carpinus fangiana]|uniref:SEC7 domain-containing protein n=1 Tax=Carpinus fangiana TaxID=176857 RepID=A0A5N6KW06_9ROSI|nr:hypothetical protein FH972_023716 [Carpinus fangiana]
MPLGVLRKKPSLKDAEPKQASDAPTSLATPEAPRVSTSTNNDLLRPESAASRRTTSRASGTYNSRPSLSHRPPSAGGVSVTTTNPRHRLSLMRSRYASDPQISARYRNHAPSPSTSDAAPPPTIGVTAPPSDHSDTPKKSKLKLLPFFGRSRTAANSPNAAPSPSKKSWTGPRPSMDQPRRSYAWSGKTVDGAAGSSETASSISRDNSTDVYGYDLPAEKPKSSSASAFFKFRRKRKDGQLFPLPPELDPSGVVRNVTPRSSYSPAPSVVSPSNKSVHEGVQLSNSPVNPTPTGENTDTSDITIRPVSGAITFAGPTPPLLRHTSSISAHSVRSASFAPPQPVPKIRSRSNTMKSLPGIIGHERNATTATFDSGRASTASTTLGRNSMAGLRSLTSRLRHPSEPISPNHFSPSNGASATPTGSASHSFAISRETLVVPDREEGETAGKYFGRLEQDFPKKSIAMAFSKSSDTFSHDVLRSLMRTFKFYEEPMDISLRRFLWEIDLPGEAQQIDRVISAFAERYHECNPHIFDTFDEAYLVAYSLIILHSDLFNKNNKHKMQRGQYQKNTGGHGVHEEILGYFYDNIQYTEFIAQNVDDDESDKKAKTAVRKAKKATNKLVASQGTQTGKLDPYSSIIDENLRLDILRASLREVLNLDNTFNYLGTAASLDLHCMRTAFNKFGVLQVVSSRSRPDAFVDPMTMTNPMEALPGVVDIKVAKVGTLWRKEAKKKKGRSPWQEWGAILTPSQLYFFRNSGWAKGLMGQADHHQKFSKKSSPVIFRPPLEEFKYDASVALVHATALQDTNYRKHKHAFVLARKGDMLNDRPHERYFEEVLLADNESEMNDWLAKLNYAATCTTTNVRLPPRTASAPALHDSGERQTLGQDENLRLAPVTTHDERHQIKEGTKAGWAESATQRQLRSKIEASEERIKDASKKLDENLKTARHLEILAPFPNKTRGDLLSFGARMAHNIKWSRYDVLRCMCQRDILTSELEADDGHSSILTAPEADPVPKSPISVSPSTSTSRMGSKNKTHANRKSLMVEAPQMSPRISLSRASFSGSSPSASSKRNSVIAGIDSAFATPSETLTRFGTTDEGMFKLPPLQLGASRHTASDAADDNAIDTQDESSHRRSSISSAASSAVPSQHTDTASDAATPRQSTQQTEKVLRASPMERGDESIARSSPSHRSSKAVRRSMQRTLRDSKDRGASPHHSHSNRRRHKDSFSSHSAANTDDGHRLSTNESEGLARRPGSFKVHGKKASVITLGSEWQKVSPEERLRQRRQLVQADDGAGGVTKYHTARSSMQHSPRLGTFADSPSDSETAVRNGGEMPKSDEDETSDEDDEGREGVVTPHSDFCRGLQTPTACGGLLHLLHLASCSLHCSHAQISIFLSFFIQSSSSLVSSQKWHPSDQWSRWICWHLPTAIWILSRRRTTLHSTWSIWPSGPISATLSVVVLETLKATSLPRSRNHQITTVRPRNHMTPKRTKT